jgi:predicted nucleic acid-binding protein
VAYLIDTSVAIPLRDGDQEITSRLEGLGGVLLMSVITRVELEGGVGRDPQQAAIRRRALDLLLAAIPILAFEEDAAVHYGKIVAAAGYSRRKILDRMIAAQALQHRAVLLTLNADDFANIEALRVMAL